MNKSNLIEDSATQIWNLIKKRSELVKNLDPVNFFIEPPQEYMGFEYFDDVVLEIKDLIPDFRKLDDEFKCLLIKLEKHGIGFKEIEDSLRQEYYTWKEGMIYIDVVELFLSLPAEHVCTKLLRNSFDHDDPITDLHRALCGYDGAPLNGISSKDNRLEGWRTWYKKKYVKPSPEHENSRQSSFKD